MNPSPPIKPPYCPPSEPAPTPQLQHIRNQAKRLATFAAASLHIDNHGAPYIDARIVEAEIMKALLDAHAAGMVEATDVFVQDQVEKNGSVR